MDRFTWGIVGGTVLLLILGLAAVVLVQRPPAPPDLTTPEGVVRAYVVAVDAGRLEDAWALLAPSAQAQTTRDEFIREMTNYGGRRREGRLAIEAVEVQGTVARMELARTYRGSGGLFGQDSYTERQTARLELIGGGWRITVPPEPFLLRRPVPAVPPTPVPPPTTAATLAPVPTPTAAGTR